MTRIPGKLPKPVTKLMDHAFELTMKSHEKMDAKAKAMAYQQASNAREVAMKALLDYPQAKDYLDDWTDIHADEAKRFEKITKNPSTAEAAAGPHASAATRLAIRKASAFFGREDLVTQVREIHIDSDVIAAVEIGGFIALEYESKKFDGKTRVYRHETDVKRKIYISTDGNLIFIHPPFKVTKRGIEG